MYIVTLVLGVTVLSITSAHTLNRIDNSTLTTSPAPTCWWDGTEYHHGDRFPRNKSCPTHASCECRSGQVSCVYADCPAENHPCYDPVTLPCGCPYCHQEPKCLWKGREYNNGDHFYGNEACPAYASCNCNMGQVICVYADCPSQHLPCVDPVSPGCGCAYCPNGPNCYLGNKIITGYLSDGNRSCRCIFPSPQAYCDPPAPLAPPTMTPVIG